MTRAEAGVGISIASRRPSLAGGTVRDERNNKAQQTFRDAAELEEIPLVSGAVGSGME